MADEDPRLAAREYIDDAIASLQLAREALTPAEPPATAAIATPQAFDQALATTPAGGAILLDPTLVYPAALTLRTSVRLQVAADLPLERITAEVPLPRFLSGISIPGNDVTLVGLEVRGDVASTLVDITGARVTLDRVRVLGDPVKGGRRGIAANGNGAVQILRSIVDDIFGPYPSPDNHEQQAIFSADMAPGLQIVDNFLRAGTQTILLGGDDSRSADRMPTDVLIKSNTITKRSEWQLQAVSVKNALEIKAGKRIQIYDNDISESWGGHGQDGYLLMLTVRNQGGKAPWSTIEDVTIANNRFHDGAAAINVLGRDDRALFPSGTLRRVAITNNRFDNLAPKAFSGSPKMILIGWGPDVLTIDGNVFTSPGGLSSQVYFQGPVPPAATSLQITNNKWPRTTYGIFASGVAADGQAAWAKYVLSGSHEGNVVDAGAPA